jgi:hypothetical protein
MAYGDGDIPCEYYDTVMMLSMSGTGLAYLEKRK